MGLTTIERLILANQYTILEKLYPDEAQNYADKWKIVSSGYTALYGELTRTISEEMSQAVCEEVTEILDMYRALHDAQKVPFPGFDGNNENEYFDFAKFVIQDWDRWREFATSDLNSHRQMLSIYRTMLREWNASANRFTLTPDDVKRILEAGGDQL